MHWSVGRGKGQCITGEDYRRNAAPHIAKCRHLFRSLWPEGCGGRLDGFPRIRLHYSTPWRHSGQTRRLAMGAPSGSGGEYPPVLDFGFFGGGRKAKRGNSGDNRRPYEETPARRLFFRIWRGLAGEPAPPRILLLWLYGPWA